MTQTFDAADRLAGGSVACRVHLKWLGVKKTLTDDQVAQAARGFDADRALMSAAKTIIDTRDPHYRRLTRLRSRVKRYWQEVTLPFPESGVRLLPRGALSSFDEEMQGRRVEMHSLASVLQANYDQIRASAREKLGALYNPHDYPDDLAGQFDLTWDYPSVDPPDYLMHLKPQVYQAECVRVRAQFEQAVRDAEGAFAEELLRLTESLADKLAPTPDGKRKVFRESAVENLRAFCDRFRTLAVTDDGQLRELVDRAEAMLDGATASELRNDDGLRRKVQENMALVAQSVEAVVAPRRAVRVRNMSNPTGGNGAPALTQAPEG